MYLRIHVFYMDVKGYFVYAFHIIAYLFNTYTHHALTQTPPSIFSFLPLLIIHWHSITAICLNLRLKWVLWTWLAETALWIGRSNKKTNHYCFASMSGHRKSGNFPSFYYVFFHESVMLKSETQGGEDVHRPLHSQNETLNSTCFLKRGESKKGSRSGNEWGEWEGWSRPAHSHTCWASQASDLAYYSEPVFVVRRPFLAL